MALKLIVEAGSTKTDSVIINTSKDSQEILQSPGINPVTDSQHKSAIQSLVNLYEGQRIDKIYYYGSGCINHEVNHHLAQSLIKTFGYQIDIEVQDDLLAVARGICQKEKGIVCILGTGSNVGYYDGKVISDGVQSCGYLLGDEGSGYRLGQAIYLRLVRNLLSQELTKEILQEAKLTDLSLIQALYAKSNPRQFLASFATFVKKLTLQERTVIAGEVFAPFIEHMIIPMIEQYDVSIHLSGSIAHHFEEELRMMFKKFDIIASSFERSPLEGLIRYHYE